tara:strand:- start:726 stop:1466 length:741 start_codon:yes stop_codon:yes gene_type:complete
MKKILYLICAVIFFGFESTADISKIKVDGRLRYFSTLVDNLGKDYDSARPGPVLDLHLSYPVSPKLVIKNFNYFVNYNDTTSGDEEMNVEINQRLAFMYINKGKVIAPYLKMINHDKNPTKQVDNSHKGIYLEQFFTKDRSFSLDYREELSDGARLGKVRYGQRVVDLRYKNNNLFNLFDRPVHMSLGYAEGTNLRGVKSLIFRSDISEKLEVTLKYIDNIGKGPIGSSNLAQNRDFLVSEIGFKF